MTQFTHILYNQLLRSHTRAVCQQQHSIVTSIKCFYDVTKSTMSIFTSTCVTTNNGEDTLINVVTNRSTLKGNNTDVSQIIRKIAIFNTGVKSMATSLCMSEK